MGNTIEYATLIQNSLDKLATQEMLTSWMDANAGQVVYTGGKEVKIPKLSVDGLADYGRIGSGTEGYTAGSVNFGYSTFTMTQDRGRSFTIDAMDVDETGFVLTASSIMGEFQRTRVVPEIDAYRLSAIAAKALDANRKYSYTPEKDTIIQELKAGVKAIREAGHNGDLIIHATYDVMMEYELAMLGRIQSTTFSRGGLDTKCPAIDGCPIIETPQNRMYSAIKLYDGATSGQEAGGYVKGDTANDINFIIMQRTTPIAVTKQDVMRIFDPTVNQRANAWAMDYRRYHDLWIKDNAQGTIYVNLKGAKA